MAIVHSTPELRIRPPRGTLVIILAIAVAEPVQVLIERQIAVSHHRTMPDLLFWPAFLILGPVGIALACFTRWSGITLTPTHAVINSVRRRQVPLADIQAVTCERFLTAPRVVLYTRDRRRIRLHAPSATTGGRRDRFDDGYHAIGQWWLDHRGPDWIPGYTDPPGKWVWHLKSTPVMLPRW